MKKKLSWVHVLNEQSQWASRQDFQSWFNELVGRPTNLLDGTVEGFFETLGFMRRSVANLHFDEPVDLLWLDTQLKTVTLGLLHHQGAQEGEGSSLPRFRARVKGMIDSDLLRAVKDSLLIQFAEYIGDVLDGTTTATVLRCEGIRRQPAGDTAQTALYFEETEQRFRQEIAVLARVTPATEDLNRCTNLFLGGPKSRYCSDECRFASVQTEKNVQEPTDLTAKQRRFRRRNQKAE